ncbi:MAG: hypothetical protein PHR69_09485 [Sphaerochaeta sp.]|nr:hypothetical protein [Sphaerochaeta sp.]
MKHSLKPIFLLPILLLLTNMLLAAPNLYVLSLFDNESITNTRAYGGRATIGFGNDELYSTASFRLYNTDTNTTMNINKKVFDHASSLTGYMSGNIAYSSHDTSNGTTSAIGFCTINYTTPFSSFPTLFSGGVGVHIRNSWSKYHDRPLWDFAPYLSLSVTQGLLDLLYVNLFINTDVPTLRAANLSYWYGCSVSLALNKNIMVVIRPMARLSDFTNESQFVSEREISCSLCWTDSSTKNYMKQGISTWI